MPADGPARNSVFGQQLEHELEHGVARVERLHVDVQVRAELARAAQQPTQPVGGVALAALGRVGPQQRRERGDLDREVRARERADAVALERRALRPAARGGGERLQRDVAALGVALRLGLGDGRLAEQVDGADATPSFHSSRSVPSAAFGVSPTMKRCAMCLTPAAAAAPSAVRPARVLPIRIATATGGGGVSTSPRKPVRWRARSSSERHAGTTSTKRNSAALSSASWEASAIAFSSAAAIGLRGAGGQRVGEPPSDASSRPRAYLPARRREAAATVAHAAPPSAGRRAPGRIHGPTLRRVRGRA